MARRRRFSEEPFGPTIERLMSEKGVTYRGLAEQTNLSAGYLNHLVHGNRPVPSNEVIASLAKALGVAPEHFREYRIRVVTERLETMPDLVDRLYKRLGTYLSRDGQVRPGSAAGRTGPEPCSGATSARRARSSPSGPRRRR